MLNRIITIGVFLTIFFNSYVLFKTPFEGYFSYIIIILLLPILIVKFKFPIKTLYFLIPLLLSGLYFVWTGDNTAQQFIKIALNIIISTLFYFYIFPLYNFDVEKLFIFYLKGAFIVSIIGIIQVFSYRINFRPGYDYSMFFNKWDFVKGGIGIRLNSIFAEPSYFANTIAPAFFISLYNLTRAKSVYYTRAQSIVVIIAYLLTFSTVGYMGIFVAILLLVLNFGFIRYVILVLPILFAGYQYLYQNVDEFRLRVTGLDELYSGKATSSFKVHGSSFVQFNNTHVATENFKRHPLFGTGLGSHVVAYKKYSLVKQYGGINDFNSQDANSMALRLMSETGLFGLLFFLLFIIRYFVSKPDSLDLKYWLISNSCLLIIILQLVRQGNYTFNGFFFFLWLYFFNNVQLNNAKQQ